MAKDDTTEDSSEDPKYRPPLAMGGGNDSSRDEDSEIKCPYSLLSSDGNGNWGFWADHEDNMTTIVKRTPTTPPNENKFIASGGVCPITFPSGCYELCLGCKNMFTTSIYCKSCWKKLKILFTTHEVKALPIKNKSRSTKTNRTARQ